MRGPADGPAAEVEEFRNGATQADTQWALHKFLKKLSTPEVDLLYLARWALFCDARPKILADLLLGYSQEGRLTLEKAQHVVGTLHADTELFVTALECANSCLVGQLQLWLESLARQAAEQPQAVPSAAWYAIQRALDVLRRCATQAERAATLRARALCKQLEAELGGLEHSSTISAACAAIARLAELPRISLKDVVGLVQQGCGSTQEVLQQAVGRVLEASLKQLRRNGIISGPLSSSSNPAEYSRWMINSVRLSTDISTLCHRAVIHGSMLAEADVSDSVPFAGLSKVLHSVLLSLDPSAPLSTKEDLEVVVAWFATHKADSSAAFQMVVKRVEENELNLEGHRQQLQELEQDVRPAAEGAVGEEVAQPDRAIQEAAWRPDSMQLPGSVEARTFPTAELKGALQDLDFSVPTAIDYDYTLPETKTYKRRQLAHKHAVQRILCLAHSSGRLKDAAAVIYQVVSWRGDRQGRGGGRRPAHVQAFNKAVSEYMLQAGQKPYACKEHKALLLRCTFAGLLEIQGKAASEGKAAFCEPATVTLAL